MTTAQEPPSAPTRESSRPEKDPSDICRLVILGASNVARCLPTALATARAFSLSAHPTRPSWIAVAAGRGRSYGQTSTLLGRTLPGILPSGLWQALDRAPPGPTYALLTDIGNDIAYGVDPELLVDWLAATLDQLPTDTRVSVTALPLDNLDRFPIPFLEIFRKTLFPSSDQPVTELLRRAEIVDDSLRNLCAERGIEVVEQPDDWFSLDPIHYRLRHRHLIWSRLLEPWLDADTRTQAPPTTRSRNLPYSQAWPEHFSVFGRRLERQQPCLSLKDGTPVHLF